MGTRLLHIQCSVVLGGGRLPEEGGSIKVGTPMAIRTKEGEWGGRQPLSRTCGPNTIEACLATPINSTLSSGLDFGV